MKLPFALLVTPTVAVVNSNTQRVRGFLAAGMQPEVVAHTLVEVQDVWKTDAVNFIECTDAASANHSTCDEGVKNFRKSCKTIADAVVRASGGDWHVVQEYMDDVCGEKELDGWRKERCAKFGVAVSQGMKYDSFGNRENFNADAVCTQFWSQFADLERDHVEKARAERKAAEDKAAAEKAEADRKQAEQDAIVQKQHAKEEAEKKAEEARKLAENAAAEMQARKEEAEKKAEEAKQKVAEAQAAAAEAQHKRELAEQHLAHVHNKTGNHAAANVTKANNATETVVSSNVTAPSAKNATLMEFHAKTHAVTMPF